MAEYQQEYERFAEWFRNNTKGMIIDRDSFNREYARETGITESGGKSGEFRDNVFRSLEETIKDNILFKKAGGKDLIQDRRATSSIVVKTKRQYIKRGARNVDLTGFDTKNAQKSRIINIPSITKGKVVYSEKITVMVKNKPRISYRDSKGRFSSVRK